MSAKFTLQDSDVKRIQDQIERFPKNAEKKINDYLKKEGKETLIQGVTKYTPVSNRKKKHARNSKPYKGTNGNLSVKIESKSPYNYLYFPNAGTGTSKRNPRNEGFMQDGIDAIHNQVINDLLDAIGKEI